MSWKKEERKIKEGLEKNLRELEKMLKDGADEIKIEKLFDEIRQESISYNYGQRGWDLLKKYNPKLNTKISGKIIHHPTK